MNKTLLVSCFIAHWAIGMHVRQLEVPRLYDDEEFMPCTDRGITMYLNDDGFLSIAHVRDDKKRIIVLTEQDAKTEVVSFRVNSLFYSTVPSFTVSLSNRQLYLIQVDENLKYKISEIFSDTAPPQIVEQQNKNRSDNSVYGSTTINRFTSSSI